MASFGDSTIERTLVMRVSAEEGPAKARIVVPELHNKSARMNATPNPYLDAALRASDSHRSAMSDQEHAATPTDVATVGSSPTNASQPKRSIRLGRRTRPLVVAVLAVAVLALISLVVFYPSQTSEPQQTTTAPPPTSAATITTEATSTTAPRTVSPTAAQRPTTSTGSIDAAFAQTLTDLGIDYSSPAQAVSVAKTTCRTITNSANPTNAILAASEIAQRSGGFTRTEANDFVGLAVAAYCPECNAYVQN